MDARERERERESQMAHNTQIGLDYGICCRVVLLETQSGVNGADRVDSIKSMGLIRVRREEGGGKKMMTLMMTMMMMMTLIIMI